MAKKEIYLKKDGTSFEELITREKDSRRYTWAEFSKKTGVPKIERYSTRSSRELFPTDEKFEKIIKYLGYSADDFVVNGTSKYNNKRIENHAKTLEKIAETALEKEFDIIRSPLVRTVGGETFYYNFGKGEKKMYALIEEIHKLNPDKYGHLKYIPHRQNKKGNKPLCSQEIDIILNTLIEYTNGKNTGKNLPKGTYETVKNELSKNGFERSKFSLAHHIPEIWYGTGDKNIPEKQGPEEINSEPATDNLSEKEKIAIIWKNTYLKSHSIPLDDFAEKLRDGNKKACCSLESKLNRSITSSSKLKNLPRDSQLADENHLYFSLS